MTTCEAAIQQIIRSQQFKGVVNRGHLYETLAPLDGSSEAEPLNQTGYGSCCVNVLMFVLMLMLLLFAIVVDVVGSCCVNVLFVLCQFAVRADVHVAMLLLLLLLSLLLLLFVLSQWNVVDTDADAEQKFRRYDGQPCRAIA